MYKIPNKLLAEVNGGPLKAKINENVNNGREKRSSLHYDATTMNSSEHRNVTEKQMIHVA